MSPAIALYTPLSSSHVRELLVLSVTLGAGEPSRRVAGPASGVRSCFDQPSVAPAGPVGILNFSSPPSTVSVVPTVAADLGLAR